MARLANRPFAWLSAMIFLAGCYSSTTPAPLAVSPTTLSFTAATSATQTIAITDGTPGPYTASGCTGIVTVSVSGTTASVMAVSAGSCTFFIYDSGSNRAAVAVSVTSVSIPVQ